MKRSAVFLFFASIITSCSFIFSVLNMHFVTTESFVISLSTLNNLITAGFLRIFSIDHFSFMKMYSWTSLRLRTYVFIAYFAKSASKFFMYMTKSLSSMYLIRSELTVPPSITVLTNEDVR